MPLPVLKDYQVLHQSHVVRSFQNGIQRLLMVMPCGTGKTTVFSSLSRAWEQQCNSVLVIVHRIELLDQVVNRLADFGIRAGIIAGGEPFERRLPIQVGMIQSIPSDLDWKPDFIVIDECHHSTAESYQRLWALFPEARILGVTASPVRLDGKSFAGLYNNMLDLLPTRWYMEHGHLVYPKHYVCSAQVERLRMENGEYDLAEMSTAMRKEKKIADIIKSYQVYAPNRRAVVFAVDVPHSLDIVKRFNACGIPAAHIDSKIDKSTRTRIVEDFRAGRIKVLSNFDIVSEGFDVPAIEAVIFARMSKSLPFFIQGVGRCLRPDVSSGKQFGYVLDCSGMWLNHGIAGANYQWSLTGSASNAAMLESKLYATDKTGRIFSYVKPSEDAGIELCQLSEDLGRLVMFDKYLREVDNESVSPSEAVRRYDDYLRYQGFRMSRVEKRYCEDKLVRMGERMPAAFWNEFLEVA